VILAPLRVLDELAARASEIHVSPEIVSQLRTCCRLLGVPTEFCDDADGHNFLQKIEYLRRMRKSASDQFGATLLAAREHEDVGDIDSAVTTFDAFLTRTPAEGYKGLARSEIARLRRLQNT
jgi:hypothetical protein